MTLASAVQSIGVYVIIHIILLPGRMSSDRPKLCHGLYVCPGHTQTKGYGFLPAPNGADTQCRPLCLALVEAGAELRGRPAVDLPPPFPASVLYFHPALGSPHNAARTPWRVRTLRSAPWSQPPSAVHCFSTAQFFRLVCETLNLPVFPPVPFKSSHPVAQRSITSPPSNPPTRILWILSSFLAPGS